MTQHRPLFGTEQEYGIQLLADDAPSPMQLSNDVIRAYQDATSNPMVGYDYADESPLLDQWGFELARSQAHPDLLTDERPPASRMLTNGARFYVDHAHPEYSGPECSTVRDAVRFDRAGDLIMHAAGVAASSPGRTYRLFKNTTDGKGQSYGAHENYLIDRAVPFADVVAGFTPFLATRGVLVGAGRVGRGIRSDEPGFQLTQRADFFEREVGLETTMRRPIINTRDEPHADRRTLRRLHVITGDANFAQRALFLKIGSAALTLAAIERGATPDLALAHPVLAMRTVSYDLTCAQTLELGDGRRMSALDIQEAYCAAVAMMVVDEPVLGVEDQQVLSLWQSMIDILRTDAMKAASSLDWPAKLRLLNSYRNKGSLSWDSPTLAAIDLQYADIDPARGIALALERKGALAAIVEPNEIQQAVTQPPTTTRAWLRGELLRRFGDRVHAMSWDAASVECQGGRRVTLRLNDPHEHGHDAVVAATTDIDHLVRLVGETVG